VDKVVASRAVPMAVEDDELTRRLIRARTRPHGPSDPVLSRRAEALNLLRRVRPDAILMTSGCPGSDGVSLTERLKASPALADIPIIMMSGDSRVEDAGSAAWKSVPRRSWSSPSRRQSLTMKLTRLKA
jgi:CheY-like chemotaxis protein